MSQADEMLHIASDALLELRANGGTAHVVVPCKTFAELETAPAVPTPAAVDEAAFLRGIYALYLGEQRMPSSKPYREGGQSPLEIQLGYVREMTAQRSARERQA